MKKKMNKVFVVCLAATAMTAGMSVSAFAQVHIGGTTYKTFDEAVAAAEDGAVIVLDTDEATSGLNLSKNLTVDGGTDKKNLTFTDKGIALWGKKLTFKNCAVELNGIGLTPYTTEWNWMTISASKDAELHLENAEMVMDGNGVAANTHAIYFGSNNKLNLKDSKLEIRNYPQDALEWDGGDGGYNVNLENSTYISDNNRSGFTGTFYATIDNSKVQVLNSHGNGSNGTYYTIKNGSEVLFDGSGTWGISAWRIDMSNQSSLTATNNGYSGIWTRVLNVDKTCKLDVEGNGVKPLSAATSGGIVFQGNGTYNSMIEKGADVTIMNNAGSGIYTKQAACDLTIGSATIINNGTGIQNENKIGAEYGGGIYNIGTMRIGSSVILYNNHAGKGADDIYNGESATLKFGDTNKEWILDDCNHAIDGWYDDTEGSRWNADGGESEHHIVLVNSGSKTGMLQIKAAHGLDADDKESRPDIDKKADGEDEIKGVKPGDNISFTLESHLPARLAGFVVRSDSNAERLLIPEKFSERMIFHDKMSKNLEFDNATLKVTVGNEGRELSEEYYKVETGKGDETFRVSIALIAAFNDGYITYDELKNAEPVIVSYDAAVSDKAIDGDKVENRAWVNDSEEDIVDGPVIDPDVPSTGGIGTKAFTAAGIALMGAAAGAVIVTDKKKKKVQ